MKFEYLENTNNGHNKYYQMEENTNGTFTVNYGRIGNSPRKMIYDMSLWDKKLNEKLQKGYVSVQSNSNTPTFFASSNATSTSTKKSKVKVNKEHLKKIDLLLSFLHTHNKEIDSKNLLENTSEEILRDVNSLRGFLKSTGQLSKSDMIYLNEIWNSVKKLGKQ